MKKKLPVFKTDKEAEDFLDRDLSDYLHAENFAPFVFEYQPKQKSINLRISEQLLSAVRADARRHGVPYQRYIRQALETAVRKRSRA
jgi:predicted DNA binding CopG/RHH family protein